MNNDELVEELRQWIRDELCLEYTGIMRILQTDSIFSLEMHFASDYLPWTYSGDFATVEDFLTKAKEQIKIMLSGERARYYRLQMKDYEPTSDVSQ